MQSQPLRIPLGAYRPSSLKAILCFNLALASSIYDPILCAIILTVNFSGAISTADRFSTAIKPAQRSS